jgi:DNA repair photolyase
MVEKIKAKTILSKLKGAPDPYFGLTYSANLYRGCQHQCIYCDSRSFVYRIEDFSKIQVKENAIELLEKELRSKRTKATVGFGSMNDCYMPIENEMQYTRKALKLLAKYKFPVHIITKGNLVTRDIDLLKKISEIYAAISITITTTNDELSKKIEARSPASSYRFKAIKELAENGIYCGVIMTPILPFITDTKENISTMVEKSAEAGAKYIIGWMGMTNREGQREYYYKKLDQFFPGVKEKYIQAFGNNYGCNSPKAHELYTLFHEKCKEYGISTKMKFYNPPQQKQLSLFNN